MTVNDPSFPSVNRELPSAVRGRGLALRDLLAVFFRRKHTVIRFFVAVVCISVIYAIGSRSYPVYPARQRVNIVPPQRVTATALGDERSARRMTVTKRDLYQDYLLIFQSSALYDDVVEALDLGAAEMELWEEEGRKFIKNRLLDTLNRNTEEYLGFTLKHLPQTDADFRSLASWRLRTSVTAEIDRHAYSILVLSYQSIYPPQQTREIIAEILRQAKKYFVENTQTQEVLKNSERVRVAREAALSEAEEELDRFRARYGLFGNDIELALVERNRERTRLLNQRETLEQEILDLKTEEDFARRLLEVAREKTPSYLSPDQVLLSELEREHRTVERDLKLLLLATPVDRQEQSRLKSKRDLIAAEILEIQARLSPDGDAESVNLELKQARIELDRIVAIRTQKEEQLAQVKAAHVAAEQDYEELYKAKDEGLALVRDLVAARRAFQEVMSQQDTLRLQQEIERDLSPFRSLGEASTASRPYQDTPIRVAVVVMGMLLGLVGGLILAYLRELLDHSIRSVEDVEDAIGIPVIASIPRSPKVRKVFN